MMYGVMCDVVFNMKLCDVICGLVWCDLLYDMICDI